MKKIALISILLSFTLSGFCYTWYPYCPSGINATDVNFGVGSWTGTICSPNGLYVWEDDIQQWTLYSTSGLPVIGTASLDAENILVAMGCGTWSDGIYTFNLQTHVFEVVEWVINPTFLIHYDQWMSGTSSRYLAGSQYGGMYESVDGLNWTEVPFFQGKSCTAVDYFGQNIVVSEASNMIHIYWSDNGGQNWNQVAETAPALSSIRFSSMGEIYGIFPGYSNSSGLWKSLDYGHTWQVEFYSDNMSSVGFDAMGTIFVGWDSPSGDNEGIAIYDPQASPPGFTFLNQGINTHINRILTNPGMSSIAIFCCTDDGVYISNDYMLGTTENQLRDMGMLIFPNPAVNETQLTIRLDELLTGPVRITILNNSGCSIYDETIESNLTNEYVINSGFLSLASGLYHIRLTSGNIRRCGRFELQR